MPNKMNLLRNQDKIFLASFILLLLLAGIMGTHLLDMVVYGADAQGYLESVHNLFNGKKYSEVHFPPGMGLLSYPLFLIVKNIPLSGMLTSYISYLATIIFAFLIARYLRGNRAGFIASSFVFMLPLLMRHSHWPMSEAAFTFFLVLSFYLMLRFTDDFESRSKGILLGLAFGFLYLIRPEGMLPCLLSLLFLSTICLWRWQRSGDRIWQYIRPAILVTFTFLLISGPYIIYLFSQTGELTISGKTEKVFYEWGGIVTNDLINPEKHGKTESILEYIIEYRSIFINRLTRNLYWLLYHTGYLLLPYVAPFFLFLLFNLTHVKEMFDRALLSNKTIKVFLVLMIFVSPLSVLLLFFINERFVLPYTILIVISLAIIMDAMLSRVGLAKQKIWLSSILLITFYMNVSGISNGMNFIGIIAPTYTSLVSVVNEKHGSYGFIRAGKWLKDNVDKPSSLRLIGPNKVHLTLRFAGNLSETSHDYSEKILYANRLELKDISKKILSGEYDLLVLDYYHSQDCNEDIRRLWREPGLAQKLGLAIIKQDSKNTFQIYGRPNN